MHHEPRNQTPDQLPLSTKPARFPPAKSPAILSLASKLASCMQHDAKPAPDTGRLWWLLMMAPGRPQGPTVLGMLGRMSPSRSSPPPPPPVSPSGPPAPAPTMPTAPRLGPCDLLPIGASVPKRHPSARWSSSSLSMCLLLGSSGYAPPKSRCSSSSICRQVASPWNRSAQDSGNHLRQHTHTQEVASSAKTRPSLQASPGWWCGTVCLVAAAPPPPPCASEGPSPSPGRVVHCARCTLRPAAGPGNHRKRPEKGARRAGWSRPWWGRAGTRQTKIATTRHRLGPRLAAI